MKKKASKHYLVTLNNNLDKIGELVVINKNPDGTQYSIEHFDNLRSARKNAEFWHGTKRYKKKEIRILRIHPIKF